MSTHITSSTCAHTHIMKNGATHLHSLKMNIREVMNREGKNRIVRKQVSYVSHVWWIWRNKHMRGENTESHPVLPQALYSRLSLCVSGCVRERNNAVLQSLSFIMVEEVKGVLEKRRAGWYSGPMWPFPSNSVWEDPLGRRDTPFLHPQTLYYTSRTDGWGGRGEAEGTEELFRPRAKRWRGVLERSCGLNNNTGQTHAISQT